MSDTNDSNNNITPEPNPSDKTEATESKETQVTATTDKKSGLKKFTHLYHPSTLKEKGLYWGLGLIFGTLFVIGYLVSIYWSIEPDSFNVQVEAEKTAKDNKQQLVTGYITTHTLIRVAETLLNKNGGYLSNDKLPPSLFMDNMPSWEFGALKQIRDFSKALRNDISRSRTQSVEDKDLARAEPQFNIDHTSWMLPAAEKKYIEGVELIDSYLDRLADPAIQDAQFFARADNLRDWFKIVEKRLGDLSQQLSASVGSRRLNTDLGGDSAARQSTYSSQDVDVKTPWLEVDDIFYEARGASWVLIHLLRAIEIDFKTVLQKKNALVNLRQIIRELEATQKTIWSPMVLNGSDFGLFANHSLVMSSYISRANAAIIDLRELLRQG